MNCPLQFGVTYDSPGDGESGRYMTFKCDKEECAWWDYNFEKCQVTAITISLADIARSLKVIAQKGGG